MKPQTGAGANTSISPIIPYPTPLRANLML